MSRPEEFDFDLMARLAKEDPSAFARKREALIQSAIDSCHHPEGARRLQFEIDAQRLCTSLGEKTYLQLAARVSWSAKRMAALVEDLISVA